MEAVMVGFVVLFVPTALYFAAKHKRKRLHLYQKVAERYDGAAAVDGGIFGRHELKVDYKGASIKVWMWQTKNTAGTKIEAHLSSRLPSFKVYREGVFSSLGKSIFGTQDIVVGAMEGFDDWFMVKGSDPGLIRSLWSLESCSLMLSRFDKGNLSCDGIELVLSEYRHYTEVDEIAAGIELIGALAQADVWGAEALRGVDQATFHDGSPPYAVVRGPVNVQIGPVKDANGTTTRASCPAGSGDNAPSAEELEAIGATFSRDDKQLHIRWPGVEKRAERLDGAVEILRRLSRGPSAGVFR